MKNLIGHIPSPRETKNLKPFLLIVSGLSGVGKSTLSKTLTETNSFIYYSTDQFKVEYNKNSFEGTGNILVDKILDKYKENIIRPGVL